MCKQWGCPGKVVGCLVCLSAQLKTDQVLVISGVKKSREAVTMTLRSMCSSPSIEMSCFTGALNSRNNSLGSQGPATSYFQLAHNPVSPVFLFLTRPATSTHCNLCQCSQILSISHPHLCCRRSFQLPCFYPEDMGQCGSSSVALLAILIIILALQAAIERKRISCCPALRSPHAPHQEFLTFPS